MNPSNNGKEFFSTFETKNGVVCGVRNLRNSRTGFGAFVVGTGELAARLFIDDNPGVRGDPRAPVVITGAETADSYREKGVMSGLSNALRKMLAMNDDYDGNLLVTVPLDNVAAMRALALRQNCSGAVYALKNGGRAVTCFENVKNPIPYDTGRSFWAEASPDNIANGFVDDYVGWEVKEESGRTMMRFVRQEIGKDTAIGDIIAYVNGKAAALA